MVLKTDTFHFLLWMRLAESLKQDGEVLAASKYGHTKAGQRALAVNQKGVAGAMANAIGFASI